jgi:uncharacterized protein YydD (DUF2326 family)
MDKEVKRVRLIRLYSENQIFDDIIFHDGINIILGEKYNENTLKGRKTNGVGKSMSIVAIDFCLLSDYKNSRIKKIPGNILGLDENICLDLKIGSDEITIIRNRREENSPLIIRNDISVKFDKIADARLYLIELIFEKIDNNKIPSIRSLISILIRDERSEFKDILECHDTSKKIPNDLTPHLFMLNISHEIYKHVQEIIKQIDTIKKIISKNKRDLTNNNMKKLVDVKAEINSLDDELIKMDVAIENFKTNDAFKLIEKDIIDFEELLDRLRKRKKIYQYELAKIKELPKPEIIDDHEIALVYNQFKNDLGDMIVKSLSEMQFFKNKVEAFQRMLINQKASELDDEIKKISKEIQLIDDAYSEKMKMIDQKGVLRNLKSGLRIYEEKRSSMNRMKMLFEEYEKNLKQKKSLTLSKSQEILKIDEIIENNKVLMEQFTNTLLTIHESIMGNKECSFLIQTIDKDQSKTPIEIHMRIYDDGSRSVNRTKVFIYDMALMFNIYTNLRHPLFLIHDNIFDVDQDTLVQCLNYLGKQEEKGLEFQYILTLNRDKIEGEERKRLINIDIDSHKVASFTKKNKFLKKDYQEV